MTHSASVICKKAFLCYSFLKVCRCPGTRESEKSMCKRTRDRCVTGEQRTAAAHTCQEAGGGLPGHEHCGRGLRWTTDAVLCTSPILYAEGLQRGPACLSSPAFSAVQSQAVLFAAMWVYHVGCHPGPFSYLFPVPRLTRLSISLFYL